MSCRFEEDLTAFVDQELPAARRAEVAQHLPGCAECRATETLLRGAVAQLSYLPEVPFSPALRRAVLTKVEGPQTLGEHLGALLRRSPLLAPAVGAAAAAALVAVVVGAPRHPEPRLDEPDSLYLAQNMEMLSDYEVVGLDQVDDLDVVAHLRELEVQP